jgi:hypothetical protein
VQRKGLLPPDSPTFRLFDCYPTFLAPESVASKTSISNSSDPANTDSTANNSDRENSGRGAGKTDKTEADNGSVSYGSRHQYRGVEFEYGKDVLTKHYSLSWSRVKKVKGKPWIGPVINDGVHLNMDGNCSRQLVCDTCRRDA